MINVAIVGVGYWGPNLARNLAISSDGRLHTLCDVRQESLAQLSKLYPGAKLEIEYDRVLDDPEVDAIAIATPVHTHFELAAAALRSGKHVLVEKPLARTAPECRELVSLAEARGLTLMVGHVFLYNAAVQRVKDYITSGELGQIYYVYSQRLNLGIVRQDVNALWNFAPHDLSIICHWLDAAPQWVTANGFSYIQPDIEDVVFLTMGFPGGVGANVHISWLDPHKIRRMTVVGSEKMVVYDDVNADAPLMVFDKGVVKKLNSRASLGQFGSFGEFQLLTRAGDVLIPKVNFVEPLKVECQHFLDCIRTGERPLTDGRHGLQIVEALEAANDALVRNRTHAESVV
jgi:predicted dehydrogenase